MMAPPKPDSAQLQHPRRLLMADLETHLMHYALDPNCTLVLMGDMNIDLSPPPPRFAVRTCHSGGWRRVWLSL